MMFLRLLCCKGEECILRHTVGAIYTTVTENPTLYRPLSVTATPRVLRLITTNRRVNEADGRVIARL
jgi:hypothetical protein